MADQRSGETGAGPGITGASGDFIPGTGEGEGVGGSGHTDDRALAGAEPDERNRMPVPDTPGAARPDEPAPVARDHPQPAARALANQPGGPRVPVPANDLLEKSEALHRSTQRIDYPRAGNPGSEDEH